MSDNERPREQQRRERERDTERSTGSERRHRSRSPRADGGRREGGRYRSRSPFRRGERGRGERGRSDRGRSERGRGDRGRGDRGRNTERSVPSGARAAATPKTIKPEDESSHNHIHKLDADDDSSDVKDTIMHQSPSRPADMDDETWTLVSTMGFGGFKSTKNTKVPGNEGNYGVRRDKQMEARQYMNRQGGFNRPLSPGRG